MACWRIRFSSSGVGLGPDVTRQSTNGLTSFNRRKWRQSANITVFLLLDKSWSVAVSSKAWLYGWIQVTLSKCKNQAINHEIAHGFDGEWDRNISEGPRRYCAVSGWRRVTASSSTIACKTISISSKIDARLSGILDPDRTLQHSYRLAFDLTDPLW